MTADLFPDAGPPHPPAAAARAGVYGATCLRFVAPATGTVRLPLPGSWRDETIAVGDELVWALMPAFDTEADEVADGFRSACVAVDLVTSDGRRLLDTVGVETDATSSAPAARDDLDFPDQWNERRVSLDALAGAAIARAELVIDPPAPRSRVGDRLEGWIDGVRIVRSPHDPLDAARREVATSPAERVSTTRGSHSSPERSRGNTQPFVGVPHGAIRLSPATDLGNAHWTYTWNAHGAGPLPELAGVLVSRSPSIWIGERGALGVSVRLQPEVEPEPEVQPEIEARAEPETFSHDDEVARPHRYRVRTTSGIRIDMAATDSAGVIEVDLPRPGVVELCAPGSRIDDLRFGAVTAGGVLPVSATVVTPSPHERDPMRSYYRLFISGARPAVGTTPSGALLETSASRVRIEVGVSQLSSAQAARAHALVSGVPLDVLADRARARWDEVLSIVEIAGDGGGDPELPALVASDLARLFLFPTRHDEDTPDGPAYPSPTHRDAPDDSARTGRRIRRGRMLTDHGFWDTYRTCWPAFALLAPTRAGAMLDGMIEHVRDAGWSPRWTAGTPLDAMVGTSLDAVAADLTLAGVGGFDADLAYAAALRNATTVSRDPRFGRKGMPDALTRGWVSADVPESVSWTLEGCVSDAGAAVLARELARRAHGDHARRLHAEARYLAHRALAYRHLWDPATGFFRPRTADGGWADDPFDPRVWGGGHTETNAWGSRFAVPHDGGGLAALFGGPTALGQALDALFAEPETARAQFAGTYGRVIHEMPEARDIRRGMWALSNQPAHHVPWMYAHSDRPWRTDEVVTDAVDRLFRGSRLGQGYPGDEDNGEMSAWHLFSTIGLAPFPAASGRMLLTAPRRPRTMLRPLGAPTLEIRAHRRDQDDRFIRAVRRDGREWTSPTVGIRELHQGGRWDIDLGPTPVPWSEPLPSRPHFAADGVSAVALRDAVREIRVVSPTGQTSSVGRADGVPLERGTTVLLTVDAVGRADAPALVLIGLEEPGRYTFTVGEGSDPISTPIAQFANEEWAWAQQVRPFEVPWRSDGTTLRLSWGSVPARLMLLQVLVPES